MDKASLVEICKALQAVCQECDSRITCEVSENPEHKIAVYLQVPSELIGNPVILSSCHFETDWKSLIMSGTSTWTC